MRKIKNTTEGGLGTYIGAGLASDGKTPIEREHVVFAPSAVTEIDEKKLTEACKNPIVKSWFDDGFLVDQTVSDVVKAAAASAEAKGAK